MAARMLFNSTDNKWSVTYSSVLWKYYRDLSVYFHIEEFRVIIQIIFNLIQNKENTIRDNWDWIVYSKVESSSLLFIYWILNSILAGMLYLLLVNHEDVSSAKLWHVMETLLIVEKQMCKQTKHLLWYSCNI